MPKSRPEFEDIVPGVGYLTDNNILAALKAGFLIETGTWDEGQLRHASYTIRLGHRVEVERHAAGSGKREHWSVDLKKGGPPLELKPGDKALLYSLENLRLPSCVLGFTVARGLLVYESLVPENTYVDPGFSGPVYTTVMNLSGRILKLPYGMPIARLFFYRLAENVGKPYQSGPAIGIDQQLDSSSGIAFPSVGEARSASISALFDDLIATERGGARTAELLRRNARVSRLALLTAAIWPIALQAAMSWAWLRNNAGALVTGIISSLLAVALIALGERLWRHLAQAG